MTLKVPVLRRSHTQETHPARNTLVVAWGARIENGCRQRQGFCSGENVLELGVLSVEPRDYTKTLELPSFEQ